MDTQNAFLDQTLAVVYVLLALSGFIALMGIANTLSLAVHERTRELGLLRAVGQTRRQLRSMVRRESVLLALFGTLVGLALGVGVGWAFVRAAAGSEGLDAPFTVPVVGLAVILLIGGIVGVLAGERPARRAGEAAGARGHRPRVSRRYGRRRADRARHQGLDVGARAPVRRVRLRRGHGRRRPTSPPACGPTPPSGSPSSSHPGPVARRPADDVWSALEYACHVRDVAALGVERLALMRAEDGVRFANWDQDATAVEGRYGEADPAVVTVELQAATAALAAALDAVEGGAWDRRGHRSDGASFTVASFARYLLHDPVHHLHDVRAGLARRG